MATLALIAFNVHGILVEVCCHWPATLGYWYLLVLGIDLLVIVVLVRIAMEGDGVAAIPLFLQLLFLPFVAYFCFVDTAPFGTLVFLGTVFVVESFLFPATCLILVLICAVIPIAVLLRSLRSHMASRERQRNERRRQAAEQASLALQRRNDVAAQEKEQSERQLRDLRANLAEQQDRVAKERDRAERERLRRVEAEKNRQAVKESCNKLILTTEATLRETEADIFEVQHSGHPSAEEALAELHCRKDGFVQEIAKLRETLASLEQE